jgi:hypothetical protein
VLQIRTLFVINQKQNFHAGIEKRKDYILAMDPNKASKTELRRGKIISWQWTQIKLSLV